MTAEEKTKMMEEIMQVVEKHVSKSEEKAKTPKHLNKYGRDFGISDEKMSKWKEEYKRMRVDGRIILENVRTKPIDTSKLADGPSFDIDYQTSLLK